LLGLSSQQLQSDLQSGQTLSSLAQQQGVSTSSLLSSVEQDLQANAPQGAPSLSSSQLQQFANNIINGNPPAGSQGSRGISAYESQSGSAARGPSFSNTAQLLGVSAQQLQSDLQSGQTLSSLAQQQGVSTSSLLSSVEQDLQANAPQGASSLSSSQLQHFANNVINGNLPSPSTSGRGHARGGSVIDQYA
jgi:LysM repeat protein